MPFPSDIVSVSAFICDRLLTEQDGVISAIRIIDLFEVEATIAGDVEKLPVDALKEMLAPPVRMGVCVIIKGLPGVDRTLQLQFKMLDPLDKLSDCGQPVQIQLVALKGEDLPASASIAATLHITAKHMGNFWLCVYLDGEEVFKTPFSIRLRSHPTAAQA